MNGEESIVLTTCPVLLLTGEIEEAFEWFHATHEVIVDFGGPSWRRMALPAAGGVGDQDARLMATLDHLRTVMNALLPRVKKDRDDG